MIVIDTVYTSSFGRNLIDKKHAQKKKLSVEKS